MFGFPLETITLLASTAISFYMKFKAQQDADRTKLLELAIKRDNNTNVLIDSAAKRGTPWVRKFMTIVVISISFVGLFAAPFFNISTEFIQEVPQKNILWGLIKWGKEYDIITSDGFLIPPYVKHMVMCIAGFFYGPGFAKASR